MIHAGRGRREQPIQEHRGSNRGVEDYVVEAFLALHPPPLEVIKLGLAATGDPVRGYWLGRLFPGDYDGHCFLRSYIINRMFPLAAKLRPVGYSRPHVAAHELRQLCPGVESHTHTSFQTPLRRGSRTGFSGSSSLSYRRHAHPSVIGPGDQRGAALRVLGDRVRQRFHSVDSRSHAPSRSGCRLRPTLPITC